MKRLLVVVACCIAAMASADLTQIDIDNAYFSGKIFAFPMPNPASVTSGEGGGTLNLIPVSYVFTRKGNIEQTAGFNTSIQFVQTKIYVPATNQFIAITPRTIVASLPPVSKVGGSDSGTNADEPQAAAKFFRAFNTAPYNTDEYRWGKFKFQVTISVSSGPFVEIIGSEFIVSPIGFRDANIDGGTDPTGAGQGITPGDLNDQPVNQEGFWQGIFSGLFIPSEETVNTLRDTCVQFSTWGPFGIISYIHTRSEAYRESEQLTYVLQVPLPMVGTTEFDLTAWEVPIKIGRTVGAMFLWLIVIGGIWKRLHSKV